MHRSGARRDVARLVVPALGRVETVEGGVVLLDASGEPVVEVSEFFASMLASGASCGSIRSYALSLLRWWRFLAAVDVPWARATRVEARDFVLWMRLAGPASPRRKGTGGYAPATVNHALAVVKMFYADRISAGSGPLVNPVPDAAHRAGRRIQAHHNPMEQFRPGRRAPLRQKVPDRLPRSLPDHLFDALFAAMRSDRDRALLAFYVSTGARASELLGVLSIGRYRRPSRRRRRRARRPQHDTTRDRPPPAGVSHRRARRAATADADGLPSACGLAQLATEPVPVAHSDGRYTPVLLVHGFLGDRAMWSQVIDRSTLPGPVNPQRHTLLGSLAALPGAAVYTLDYHEVNKRWQTESGAGGDVFLKAADCLIGSPAFESHQLVVVGHSMGGLIARWAVTAALGAADRARHVGAAITLGTPYEGSWLAAVGAALLGVASDGQPEQLQALVHLMLSTCASLADDGCGELRTLLDFLATMYAFVPGSAELKALPAWPLGIRVETLGTRNVLENFNSGVFYGVDGGATLDLDLDLDLGDGVVAVDSATFGDYVERVPECRYTANVGRAAVDGALIAIGQKTEVDTPRFNPLVALIFGTVNTTCGHSLQARLIQLANEVLGAVAEEVARGEPLYAYRTDAEIGLVLGSKIQAQFDGHFGEPAFTPDGVTCMRRRTCGTALPRMVVDLATLARRELGCGGCRKAVAVGGADLAWLTAKDQLVRWNGTTGKAAAAVPVRLPVTPMWTEHAKQNVTEHHLEVHAGLNGTLLIARWYHEATDSIELFLLGPDGSARPLAGEEGHVGATALATETAAGGPRLAYERGYQYEAGSGNHDIAVVDPATGKVTVANSQQLAVGLYQDGSGPLTEVVTPTDLWWGRDGNLYATIGSAAWVRWANGMRTVRPSSLWRLDGSQSMLGRCAPSGSSAPM